MKPHQRGIFCKTREQTRILRKILPKSGKTTRRFCRANLKREKHYHKGIFVDIFPGDRVAPSKLGKNIQYIACAINLLYSRGHTSGSGGLLEKSKISYSGQPKEKYTIRRERAEKSIQQMERQTILHGWPTNFCFPVAVAPLVLKKIGGG